MSWAIRVTEVPAADSLDGMRALVSAAFEELLVERALVREEIP
jgi:hypothetical protein